MSYKDRKNVAADLKLVYGSVTQDEDLNALSDFDMKWGKQYPRIAKSRQNTWGSLVVFVLQYPEVIRRIIYTTSAIEGLNRQLRKVTNNKRAFPSDDSVFKTFILDNRLHYPKMEYAYSKLGRSYGPFFEKK